MISSVLDHARLDFANPWLWLPTSAGVFGTVTAVTLAAIDRPTRADLLTCTGAMLLLMVVEGIGTILHVRANLTAEGVVVVERFLRGAPVLAPLLFANVGVLGLSSCSIRPSRRQMFESWRMMPHPRKVFWLLETLARLFVDERWRREGISIHAEHTGTHFAHSGADI